MEHPDIYSASPKDRQREQKDMQSRQTPERDPVQEREHLRAYDTMREYTAALDALPEYIRNVSKELADMQAAGVPDRAAYEQRLAELTRTYGQFAELSQRMIGLAEDANKTGDAARKMARLLMREDRREELEDAYRAAMEAPEKYGRRKTDFTPEPRPEPLETALQEYDKQVGKIMEGLIALESNIDLLEKAGRLDDNDRAEFREMLAAAYAQLDDLDRSVGEDVVNSSREHKALMGLFDKLKERVRRPEAIAASSPLSTLRATHSQVKAQYAAVQHTLTDEQRREMRTRIAQMSSLVRQAEDDAWRSMFAAAPTPPPPEPPSPEPDIQASIQLAIARATEAASAIALAVDFRAPTPVVTSSGRGIFGVLGDAFKLK